MVVLKNSTSSQAETVYQTIKERKITGGIFVKDADGYFTCDLVESNGIAVYPLDRLDVVNPCNKSYVALDDQFYITNIIEKKIISRHFNVGGICLKMPRILLLLRTVGDTQPAIHVAHSLFYAT